MKIIIKNRYLIILLSFFIQTLMMQQVFALNHANNACKKIYIVTVSTETQKNTEALIGYLQSLLTASNFSNSNSLSSSILSNAQLSAMLVGIESGHLINPITEKDARKSSIVRVYREGLELMLNKELDLALLQKNLRSLLNEKNREDDKRENIHIETVEPYVLIKFNTIPAGQFWMGDPARKQAYVTLTQPFEMMHTKVTQYAWAKILLLIGVTDLRRLTPSHFNKGADSQVVVLNNFQLQMRPDNPVEKISRDYVDEVLLKLNDLSENGPEDIQNQLNKLFPGHQKGDRYDLPTEAQWEYVATNLGQLKNKYFDRDDDMELNDYSWSRANSNSQTHPVATLKPRLINGQKFYDLSGNVSEMSKDLIDVRFEPLGGIDPVSTSGTYTSSRGGNWASGNLSFINYADAKHFRSSPLESLGLRLIRIRQTKQSGVNLP